MHSNINSPEARPTWLRLATLRARWGGISRTTLFTLQRKFPEIRSEFPFGDGLPMVRLSAIEAFEQRTAASAEAAPTPTPTSEAAVAAPAAASCKRASSLLAARGLRKQSEIADILSA